MNKLWCFVFCFLCFPIQGANQPRPLETQRIFVEPLKTRIERTGKVDYRHLTALAFKTSGYVEQILSDEGQLVSGGELLAKLDRNDLQASLSAALAETENARADLRRAQKLFKDKTISEDVVEDAQNRLKQAQAELKVRKHNLSHSNIVAPFDAIIVSRMANPGELQNAGAPVFSLAALDDNLVVRMELTQKEIAMVRPGTLATVHLPNGEQATGEVTAISARADNNTGLFSIEISLPGANIPVYAGQWVHTELIINTQTRVMPLPVTALAGINQGQAVFLQMQGDTPVRQESAIHHFDQTYVYIATRDISMTVVTRGWDRWLNHMNH